MYILIFFDFFLLLWTLMLAFITVDGNDYNDDDNEYGDYGDDCLKLVSLIFAVNVQNNYKLNCYVQ